MQSFSEIATNVNNVKYKNLNNVNNVKANPANKKVAYGYNVTDVRRIADTLVEKLNDPNSYKFFCKVAWQLPENRIYLNLEQALSGKNPKAYFTFLCKLELSKA